MGNFSRLFPIEDKYDMEYYLNILSTAFNLFYPIGKQYQWKKTYERIKVRFKLFNFFNFSFNFFTLNNQNFTTLALVQNNNNSWTGTNTYNSSLPTSTITPSSSYELVNFKFVNDTFQLKTGMLNFLTLS